MKIKATLAVVAAALMLAACGKEPTPENEQPKTATSQAPVVEQVRNNDPKGDASVPLSQYKEITEAEHVLAQYVRLAGVPADVSKMAGTYLSNYYQQTDAFKRKEMEEKYRETLAQLGKKGEQAGAYFWINMSGDYGLGPNLEAYDFDKTAFPIKAFYQYPANSERRQARYSEEDGKDVDIDGAAVHFPNWSDFQIMTVADPAIARRMEEERVATTRDYSTHKMPREGSMSLRIYAFAAAPAKTQGSIRAQIMKLVVVDKAGNVVAQM